MSKSKDSALKQLQKNITTKDINQMDFRELRNEVQSLKDTLTRALRTYEDLLYNLDNDNFSSTIIKEKNDMKTQITVTAEGLSAQITAISDKAEELSTKISVQAGDIETVTKRVSDTEMNITNIKADYDAISTQVETIEGDLANYSTITQTDDKISLAVRIVEDNILTYKTEINASVNGLESTVSDIYGGEYSLFSQTEDGFLLDGSRTSITGVIFLTDKDNNNIFSIDYVDTAPEYNYVLMHGMKSGGVPMILGDKYADGTCNVYIGNNSTEGMVVTREYLEKNGSGVAVFG